MKPADFQRTSLQVWNDHLAAVEAGARGDPAQVQGQLMYPTMALATETRTHHILELFGFSPTRSPLALRKRKRRAKLPSLTAYLTQFSYSPQSDAAAVSLGAGSKILMTPGRDRAYTYFDGAFIGIGRPAADARPLLPHYRRLHMEVGGDKPGVTQPLYLDEASEVVMVDHSTLHVTFGGTTRTKSILHVCAVRKDMSRDRYSELLSAHLSEPLHPEAPVGLTVVGPDQEAAVRTATQFAGLFLLPGAPETSLSTFLDHHSEVLLSLFGHVDLLPQQPLPWMRDGKVVPGDGLQPDFLLKREDGFFDICDLKLALTNRRSITRGPKKRRRFIDFVDEAISQVGHYREYFSDAECAAHARNHGGIQVKDPRLIVVVGNLENFKPLEVEQAARCLRDGIVFVDYDTLFARYLLRQFLSEEARQP